MRTAIRLLALVAEVKLRGFRLENEVVVKDWEVGKIAAAAALAFSTAIGSRLSDAEKFSQNVIIKSSKY